MNKIIKLNNDVLINVNYLISAEYNPNTKTTTVYLRNDINHTFTSLSIDEVIQKLQPIEQEN